MPIAETGGRTEDELMELALEAGAEDLEADDEEYYRVLTAAEELHLRRQCRAIGGSVNQTGRC